MTRNSYYPTPTQQRGMIRWVILFVHSLIFAGAIFAYPSLAENNPDVFTGNLPWMILSGWGVLVLVHLFVVMLVELLEGASIARRERRRKRELAKARKQRGQHLTVQPMRTVPENEPQENS